MSISFSADQYYSGISGPSRNALYGNYSSCVFTGSIGLDVYQKYIQNKEEQKSSEIVSLNQNFFKEETKITLNQNS